MTDEKILIIDGKNFSDFKGFILEFNLRVFGDDRTWSGNLDTLNDMLRGGYGTPDEPFAIRWLNSNKSQADLGHEATLKWFSEGRKRVHPTNLGLWDKRIELAKHEQGETLFLMLVDIIVRHKHIGLFLE